MAIDFSKNSNVTNILQKNIEKNIVVASKSEVDKTAKKINYWAVFGLMFFTIGMIASTIATCGLNQIIFHATVATFETILGFGSIILAIGAIFISKVLIEKNINQSSNIAKKSNLVGIANKDMTCWLNSLMQMLLNIPDIKKMLNLNPHFKEFIDNYEKSIKRNILIDSIALKNFLMTICPDINDVSHIFHDSHEVLKAILDYFKNSNPDLKNTLIIKNHFLHSNGKKTIREERLEDTGILELSPPPKKQKKDNIERWLATKFLSKQNNEIVETATVQRSELKKYFFGLISREENITEEIVVDKKINFLEERKLSVAPKDLFLAIQKYEFDKKANQIKKIDSIVEIPFKLKISKDHFENASDTSYQLNNFICHTNMHYIAYVKKERNWFKCNDESVKKISLNQAKKASQNAYIVHYGKLG